MTVVVVTEVIVGAVVSMTIVFLGLMLVIGLVSVKRLSEASLIVPVTELIEKRSVLSPA